MYKTEDNEKLILGEEYFYHDNVRITSFTLGLSIGAIELSETSYFRLSESGGSITFLKNIKVFKNRENCASDLKAYLTKEFEERIKNL